MHHSVATKLFYDYYDHRIGFQEGINDPPIVGRARDAIFDCPGIRGTILDSLLLIRDIERISGLQGRILFIIHDKQWSLKYSEATQVGRALGEAKCVLFSCSRNILECRAIQGQWANRVSRTTLFLSGPFLTQNSIKVERETTFRRLLQL